MKKFSISLLLIFVMIICCVSAVSATDIDDNIVPDDVDIIALDDAADSVDVEQEKAITITDDDYYKCFDENGYLNDTQVTDLTFSGNFNAKSFGNFKIDKTIALNVNEATFNGVSFDLMSPGLVLDGATFINDARSPSDAYLYVTADNTVVQNLNVVLTAGSNVDYYGISVENAANVQILNNVISYTCSHSNSANYNYVIRAMNCTNLKIAENNLTAYLPLKTVSWSLQGILADYVAGVAVEKCNNLNFTKNNLTVLGNARVGDYPTLDALMIVNSNNSYVGDNKIDEKDTISNTNEYSYIYGIDVYQCNNITINNNTVNMNGNDSATILPSGNATGAAYCVQLTGPHDGVVISNNTLTTKNGGPNLGIYSQNYNEGSTNITVTGNVIDVTGKAGREPWYVLSGMELQDDYAYVRGNIVTVHNEGGFIKNCQAWGISYCQYTAGNHYYEIENNTVTVNVGTWAVYIMAGNTDGFVSNNTLVATGSGLTGNNAARAPDLTVSNNN